MFAGEVDSPKSKDSKNWKGKIGRKFKRYGSSSSAPIEQDSGSDVINYQGSFGVPLEHCPPSANNEVCFRTIHSYSLLETHNG